jgi:hypothetical protein
MIEVMIMNYLHRYSSSPDSGYQDTPKSLAWLFQF